MVFQWFRFLRAGNCPPASGGIAPTFAAHAHSARQRSEWVSVRQGHYVVNAPEPDKANLGARHFLVQRSDLS